jgi:hypothetical protein
VDIYFFGNGKAEGVAEMKKLLGGKGANLEKTTGIYRGQHKLYFFVRIIERLGMLFVKKTKYTCPLYRYLNREKLHEWRKGNGSTFEAA